ncbi:Fur family transcriptional regulator [Methylomarinum sp. Ch1-1]|uniref:Fur family transcriptional regulator n=1 Tax=Methylomarinum roseum TaxID=3067653 RepID=A0AAU7NSU7_9GAMM|nr:Fur family transcriptional regulator [Methylomarinum sp. Ch1-1]MDP4520341.1 Fur family transcriptional regulator [Methylomarinum sp. Ch1-1]
MPNNINQALDIAQSECSRSGMRLTDKRCNVLKILLQEAEPLSAYDIADRYRVAIGESLSAMSAYRMLDFLLQAGLAHKLETTNQYVACSHITCEHEHQVPQFLICDRCHTVKEVGLRKQLLNELKASIENTGFTLSSQQLELHGLCEQCRHQLDDEQDN